MKSHFFIDGFLKSSNKKESKIRTFLDNEKIINGRGFKLLRTYKNNKNKTMFTIMDKDGYKYNTTMSHIKDRIKFSIVDIGNEFSIENISIWLSKNKKNFKLNAPNIYRGNTGKLSLHCSLCDDVFKMSWSDLNSGNGCPVCAGVQTGEKHSLANVYPNLLKYWSKSNDCSPFNFTSRSHKKVYWICILCGEDYELRIDDKVTNGSLSCRKCHLSSGEGEIFVFLSDFLKLKDGEDFIRQYRFYDCRDKIPLPFDFYIPYLNLCIEYNGNQHYKPTDFFGKGTLWAKSELKKIKKRDKIKIDYCKDKKINLLIIPHWDKESIVEILKSFFGRR